MFKTSQIVRIRKQMYSTHQSDQDRANTVEMEGT